jgi:hypothetical protein
MLQEVLDHREGTRKTSSPPPQLMVKTPLSDGGPVRRLPRFPCMLGKMKGVMVLLKYHPENNQLEEVKIRSQ